ncbi:helix-turn-helix domain-containing protein [Paenibacillus sepulcri]|uniref:AraC family transcriptional regulator n=1 Tax=Paenibacillus sepulcri TaxID=359917 RepID=A0ABS7BX82_9BACL|nr:AraC family transcriptional regulator [Paenibacillus sepulcri]
MFKLHTCYIFQDNQQDWHMEPSQVALNVLIYISEGSLTYWVNGDTIHLKKGDVLFIPAGSVRGGEAASGAGHQRFATHFSLNGDDNNELLPLLKSGKWLKTRVHGEDYFKQRFSLLNHHSLMEGAYQELLCHAILLEMLIIMNQDHERRQIPVKKLMLVEELKKYIQHNYRKAITLTELSHVIDRSPSYITNLFKEVTGAAPIEYLHYIRISKSKDLMLSDPSILIREVAELTGFCDQAYFNRIFKKVTSVTPTRFLTELRIYKG